jgi:hypothetical protein
MRQSAGRTRPDATPETGALCDKAGNVNRR